MYITIHPSLVMIVYLQNGVVFFCFVFIYCLCTHNTRYTFFHYFHMCTIHFFGVDGHATFFLAFVFSLSFCVEVGFTHVDAGHCHNMTLQY